MNGWLIHLYSFLALFYVTFDGVQMVCLCMPPKFTDVVTLARARHSANRLTIQPDGRSSTPAYSSWSHVCDQAVASCECGEAVEVRVLLTVQGTSCWSTEIVSKCDWSSLHYYDARNEHVSVLLNYFYYSKFWYSKFCNESGYTALRQQQRSVSKPIRYIIITFINVVNLQFLFRILSN
jgi:hypothetical protein